MDALGVLQGSMQGCQTSPTLFLQPLQPKHVVVQPPQRLWNKVSANKGPFHELHAGPLSATKTAIYGNMLPGEQFVMSTWFCTNKQGQNYDNALPAV